MTVLADGTAIGAGHMITMLSGSRTRLDVTGNSTRGKLFGTYGTNLNLSFRECILGLSSAQVVT